MSPDEEALKGSESVRIAKHRQNAISSRLLLLRMRNHHYDVAPSYMKNKWLPSTIVGNPVLDAFVLAAQSPFEMKEVPDSIVREEFIQPRGSIKIIVAAVSNYYRVPVGQVMGRRNIKSFVRARHVAMYLAHEHTTFSMASIGRAFDKDHSVVMYATKKIKSDMAKDALLALQVGVIRKQILTLQDLPAPSVVKEVRAKRINQHDPWGVEKEVALVRHANAGMGWTNIGKVLGVSPSAACRKYQRLSAAAAVIEAALQ
jgi:hypothetical protein